MLGSERAQFVALQASANQETRLATSMKAGIALAARYSHSGVVVRLQGEGVPFNPQAMTGGRLWVDDATVKAVARPPDNPLTLPATPDEKQQRALQEQIARQARQPASPRQLDALSDAQLLRLLQAGELRPEAVRDRLPAALVREALAPMRQQDAAIQQVARESVASRSRLSSPAQGIVPDEAQRPERIKEKTLGGD